MRRLVEEMQSIKSNCLICVPLILGTLSKRWLNLDSGGGGISPKLRVMTAIDTSVPIPLESNVSFNHDSGLTEK